MSETEGYVPPAESKPRMFIDQEHPSIKELGDSVTYSVAKADNELLYRITGVHGHGENPNYRAIMVRPKETTSDQNTAVVTFGGASATAENVLPFAGEFMKASPEFGTAIAVDSLKTGLTADIPTLTDPRERGRYEAPLIVDRLLTLPPEEVPEQVILVGKSASAVDVMVTAGELPPLLTKHNLKTGIAAVILTNGGGLARQSNANFFMQAPKIPEVAAETREILPSNLDYAMEVRRRTIMDILKDPDKTHAVRQDRLLAEMREQMAKRDGRFLDLKDRALTKEGVTGTEKDEALNAFKSEYEELAAEIQVVADKMLERKKEPVLLTEEEQKHAGELEKKWQKLTRKLVGQTLLNGADASGKALSLPAFGKLGLEMTLPTEGITKEVGEAVRSRIKSPVILIFTDDDLYFEYEAQMRAMETSRVKRMEEIHKNRPELSPAEVIEEANYFRNAPAVTIVRMQGGHQESDVNPEKVARVGMEALARTQEALQAREAKEGNVKGLLSLLTQRIQDNYPNLSDAEATEHARSYYVRTQANELRQAHPGMGQEEAILKARSLLVVPQLHMTLHM